MAATVPCNPSCCATQVVVNVPGNPGNPGNNGINGVNAFTMTVADFIVPVLNSQVTVGVANSTWAVIGQIVIVGQGPTTIASPGPATFSVAAIPSPGSLTLTSLQLAGDVAPGTLIGSGTNTGGANVSPAALGPISPLPIANGGTGQNSAQAAYKALGGRRQTLKAAGLNFNITTDQAIAGFPNKYLLERVYAQNASVNLTTAAGGIYTGAGKTGTVIVPAAQVYTALTAASKWLALTIDATGGGPTTDVLTANTIFFALTTGQGAPATGDLYFEFVDMT